MRNFSTLELATPRLKLRPLHAGDADALFAIFSDPKVMRYWSSAPWTELAQAQAMIERDIAGMACGEWLRLGIERRDTGALAGHCTLFKLDGSNRRAEVGYGMGSAHWGQGLAQEALRALLAYGFDTLDLHRVEADIDPRNDASARLLQRLGFQHEGLLRERWIVAGEISDTAYYGLLQREWRAGSGSSVA